MEINLINIKNNYKIHKALLVGNKKKILIITYGDGFVESLKAKKIILLKNKFRQNGRLATINILFWTLEKKAKFMKILSFIQHSEPLEPLKNRMFAS